MDYKELDATVFETAKLRYKTKFKKLLLDIYKCYTKLISDNTKVKKDENKIRDVLVDNYLVPNISNYTFKKEKKNYEGRVDIYIVEKLTKEEPHFIIECKLLDGKNTKDSLCGKYISNGILRFLTEHYYLDNNYRTNAMIGFIVESVETYIVIDNINFQSKKLLKNLVEIKKEISIESSNLYSSEYQTGKPIKNFYIYHIMMDFSKNI